MRMISFGLAALLALGATAGLEAQTPRIAFIDSQVILAEAPGAREAQEEFDREMERYRGEIQQMGQELERLISQYQQQERTMSPEAREQRQDEIRRQEDRYQARVDEMEMEAARKRQELVEPILERMSQVIEEIRAEGDYALIFDTASRSIIAADPTLDLTEQVILRLRQAQGSGN